MTYILSTHEQGTPEWLAERLGRLTGSRAADMNDKRYAIELALERITGRRHGRDFSNDDIERGHEHEPLARMAYEVATGEMVETAGFARLPSIMAGCSVDGFVRSQNGAIEIKCPRPEIHVGYMLANEIPKQYLSQCLHNLWVTGCEWIDFVSYCDELAPGINLFVKRMARSGSGVVSYGGDVPSYERGAMAFLFRVKDIEETLRGRMQ